MKVYHSFLFQSFAIMLLSSCTIVDGTYNNHGQQELAAFLMALEDIRSQGILQNYEFKFCIDQAFGIMDGSIAVGMLLLQSF